MSISPSKKISASGRLILVVGPSGAGKDALIERAKLAFSGEKNLVFARRIVTRRPIAEDHDTLGMESFEKSEAQGDFLLSWRAHGLAYGLPASLKQDLVAGRTIIANVSRGVILQAEQLGFPVIVLHVTADPVILAARIATRGRESMAEVRARVERAAPLQWQSATIVEIRNEGTIDHGAALFIEAIIRSAEPETALVQ